MTPVLNRLKRARGQPDAAIRSIEDGQECQVAVHNLATVSRALDRAGFGRREPGTLGGRTSRCLSSPAGPPADPPATS